MAFWTHATQRGGHISLGTRKNVAVRLDGIFEAPADAALDARLKELGHKPIEGTPGPCLVKPHEPLTAKDKRIKARIARRGEEKAAAPKKPAKPEKEKAAAPK